MNDPSPHEPLDPLSPKVESQPSLLRALGPGMAIAIVVGNVIGSGIFLKPGRIAADAGEFGLIISAWIAGGLICLLGALSIAELAAMLPRAGGLYVYLREAYGRPLAFLFGYTDFLFIRPASVGALSVAFVANLTALLAIRHNPVLEVVLCLSVIGLLGWINIVGVIWGGRMQGVTTLIKAGFVAAVALLPVILWLLGREPGTFANYSTTVSTADASFSGRFALALLAVLWAYNGWEGVTSTAEEIRDPQRNLPWSLFAGLGILILLYVSANLAYHAVLPMNELAAAGTGGSLLYGKTLLGPIGSQIISVGIMLSTFGAINSNILLGPRVSFAMGRDGVFFRSLGRVHANYRTPAVAICVTCVMSAVLVIASAVRIGWFQYNPEVSIFDQLTNYVIFSSSIFFMFVVVAVFVLRRTHPEWERPYRTIGYPIVPIAYIVCYAWFLYQVYLQQPFEANVGLGLIALGVPVYLAWNAWARR